MMQVGVKARWAERPEMASLLYSESLQHSDVDTAQKLLESVHNRRRWSKFIQRSAQSSNSPRNCVVISTGKMCTETSRPTGIRG